MSFMSQASVFSNSTAAAAAFPDRKSNSARVDQYRCQRETAAVSIRARADRPASGPLANAMATARFTSIAGEG